MQKTCNALLAAAGRGRRPEAAQAGDAVEAVGAVAVARGQRRLQPGPAATYWSKARPCGRILVKSPALRPDTGQKPGPAAGYRSKARPRGRILVKAQPAGGQTVADERSNTGRLVVKYWSNERSNNCQMSGQILVK